MSEYNSEIQGTPINQHQKTTTLVEKYTRDMNRQVREQGTQTANQEIHGRKCSKSAVI